MLETIKFSIIVPVYNAEKYVCKCMRSLIDQTYGNYEVIIVDDGSKDKSVDVIQAFLQGNQKFRLVRQENKGSGGARNTGVEYATGDYIVFIDGDDYVKTTFLERVACVLLKNENLDILCYDIEEVNEQGLTLRVLQMNEGLRNITNATETPKLLTINPSPCNKLFRREFYLQTNVRFPENTLYEDTVTPRVLLACAKQVGFTEETFYYYVQHQGSCTHLKPSPRCLDIIKVMDELVGIFKAKNIFEQFFAELELVAIRSVFLFALERVNEMDYKYALQNDLVDYIKREFPNVLENKYLSKGLRKRVAVLLKRKFRRYHFRYVKLDQWKRRIKRAIKR